MDSARKITVSLALIVLVCFFLPWVQLSCGGAHDTNSGVDLAHGDDHALWLIPVLMLAIMLVGVLRLLTQPRTLFGVMSLLSGLVCTYLINHQRLRFADSSALIVVRLTGWFWLAFLSSIAVTVLGIVSVLRRPRSP